VWGGGGARRGEAGGRGGGDGGWGGRGGWASRAGTRLRSPQVQLKINSSIHLSLFLANQQLFLSSNSERSNLWFEA
jgi:hypothetical protein